MDSLKKIVFPFLILFFVTFSFYPTIYEIEKSKDVPAYRSFELIHNYITDYNFYLSRIREGWDGRWTVIERYTNEYHTGSLIQEFYLLLGKPARFIPEPTMAVTYAYQMARLVSSVLLLALTVWAATYLFPMFFWSVLAFLLAVCASGWPIIVPIGESSWRFGGYMSWFTVMDILQRITFLPHVLVGQAMVLFLVIAGNDRKTLKQKGNWIFLGVLSFLLGMIFPPGLIFVGASYGVGMLLDTFWNWNLYDKKHQLVSWWNETIIARTVIGCISIPALLYYNATLSVYPWKRLMDFGILHPVTVNLIEYMKALGPVLPLGIIGMVVTIWKKDKLWIGTISWVITWILLFWVFSYFPQQSSLRFAEMAPHIPLAFFTLYLAKSIVDYTNKKKRSVYLGVIALTVPFVCIVMGMGIMYSFWEWSRDFVHQKVGAGWPVISMDNYIVYPSNGFIEAMGYINTQTEPESVVLSELTAGNYIPARTGRRVYVGHDGSIRKEEKLVISQEFFRGHREPQDAYAFLKQEGISYIFYGPQEREDSDYLDLPATYPFLRQVYRNVDVIIYQVQ